MDNEDPIKRNLLISRYSKYQAELLSLLTFFDPEPIILANHDRNFVNIDGATISRLICWYEIREGQETNPLFRATLEPENEPLLSLLQSLNIHNAERKLTATFPVRGRFEGYYIKEVTWFTQLWSDKNPFAPPMVPKRMYSGLLVEMNKKGIFVCQKIVDTDLWVDVKHNKTRVVPVTAGNLHDVLVFSSTQILKKLESR